LNPDIVFLVNTEIEVAHIVELYRECGLNRPVEDPNRIEAMYKGANLIISAHDGDRLVGLCRALTDGHYVCYVADIAVRSSHQKRGIGRGLLERVSTTQGEGVSLILLSSPDAVDVYPRLGFRHVNNCYVRRRKG